MFRTMINRNVVAHRVRSTRGTFLQQNKSFFMISPFFSSSQSNSTSLSSFPSSNSTILRSFSTKPEEKKKGLYASTIAKIFTWRNQTYAAIGFGVVVAGNPNLLSIFSHIHMIHIQ